jgi:endoglycosylceramidase
LWVANKSEARHPFPWPLKGDCNSRPWSANELAEASSQAYSDLYHNVRGMRDDFAAFWRATAHRFANSSILGYEIINEPFAGGRMG